MAIVVSTAAWFFPKAPPPAAAQTGAVAKHDLEIIHFHLPGDPESEQIADSLNKIAEKYGAQILVTRVDINAEPERAKAEKVTKPPKVVMMAGTVRASKFQGLWTQAQIERKVEEILRGLKRMGKNWRPDVQGMQPSTQAAPQTPVQPATQPAIQPAHPPGMQPAPPPGMQPAGPAAGTAPTKPSFVQPAPKSP